jgi:hypothetical protein
VDNPLEGVCKQWLGKIRLALDFKKTEFGEQADECWRFFDTSYEWLYGLKEGARGFAWCGPGDRPKTSFAVTINKVAEGVQLFGPVLYHRNPARLVAPRKAPLVPPELFGGMADPNAVAMQQQVMAQVQSQRGADAARAELLKAYLNYTPDALDLKTESRWAIDEAVIKGAAVLWTELYRPPGSRQLMVGSFFDSIDHLVFDSDAKMIREATWCARRCIHPVWQVEREYGLEPGSLKGHFESHARQAEVDADLGGPHRRNQGKTNDLILYWKVYSKMGAGARLEGAKFNDEVSLALESLGEYCFLVVADGVPHPLNVGPQVAQSPDPQAVAKAVRWPTPFWADDSWPCSVLSFHDRPGRLWPMSHFKPGLGELKFINWCYSFLAGKIKNACRDFLAIRKSAGEEIKTSILHGQDYELLEIQEQHGTINDVVQFLQHPAFHGDIWKVLEAIEAQFERRVGLTELMYGTTDVQMRSAQEAAVKSNQLNVRPDDMAQKVEEWMKRVARSEALACQWHLTGADVGPALGPVAGQLWDRLVASADPGATIFEMEYRVEAGSVRKPNVEGQIKRMEMATQQLFQPLWNYAMQTGDVQPVNALLSDWAKANDLDVEGYLIKPPPPPPAPAAPPGAPPTAVGPGGGQGGQPQ